MTHDTVLQAKHVVSLSFIAADKEGILFARQIGPVEEHIKKSGSPFTIIRLPMFIDNNWGNLESIKVDLLAWP